MAIRLEPRQTERILFCGSKWWGDPDFPENMQYPMVDDYPLTFICQINCEDIAQYDSENLLPHEGMLYFFGAIDEYLGYDSPVKNAEGEWPKGHVVVKYAKTINFETFQTCMMVGDEGEQLTEPEMEIVFSECSNDAAGIKILGDAKFEGASDEMKSLINLFQIDEGDIILNIMIKETDLKFGNWKKVRGFLTLRQQA